MMILNILFILHSAAQYTIIDQSGTDINRKYQLQLQGYEDYYKFTQNKLVQDPILQIRKESQDQLDIRIYDQQNQQYQIPNDQEQPYKSTFNDNDDPEPQDQYSYYVDVQQDPLKIDVIRNKTQEKIFQGRDFRFSQHYLEFDNIVCTSFFFGLGERNQKGFKFKEGFYSLFARDEPKLIEDGRRPGKHIYSSQPVYLMKEQSGYYHILLYKTASPVDVQYFGETLKFITIGGIIHIKLFLGDIDPMTAIKKYHQYLGGGWALHPFWVHGFHQSRWGYKTSQALIEVIQEYQKNNIPLDVIWSDLDYMEDRQIFSVNSNLFKKKDFDYIRKILKVKYIPLLDVAVGVKYGEKDYAYKRGCEMDIFCRSPNTGLRFKGFVWPGESNFPDFFHPNISEYWNEMFNEFKKKIDFDGIWIDMNEPANFCDGECKWNQKGLCQDDAKIEYLSDELPLPYMIGNIPLDKKTLDPNLKHYGNIYHKDVHNLYGYLNSYHTYQAMQNLGLKMPFILTRSTFPGSGKFVQHWFGDNAAKWDMMYLSIGQIFQFNIFGIPFSGADVCGFMLDTEAKLCSRWIQLGSLYPFFRNHNNDLSKSQEFYALGEMVLKSAQKNIRLRYSIIKWYYTQFVKSNQTGTVFNPLFYVYHDDKEVFRDDVLDTQFMIGDSLMSTPILRKDELVRKAYFPQSTWFDFLSGMRIQQQQEDGRYHLIYCPYDDYVPLFVKGGSIIFEQNTTNIKTLNDLDNKYNLVIALDQDYQAKGHIVDLQDYLADNQVYSIYEECVKHYCVLDIHFESLKVNKFQLKFRKPKNDLVINSIKVYGLNYDGNQKIECKNNNSEEVSCHKKIKGYYSYNTVIYFDKGLVINEYNYWVYINLI